MGDITKNFVLKDKLEIWEVAKQAIEAAIEANWPQAIYLNKKVLSCDPVNTEALNRLAHSYLALGLAEKAKKIYKKVLQLDPYNSIAVKNLAKLLKAPNNHNNHNNLKRTSYSQIFLAEPGKTKLVNLLNLAAPLTLSTLTCGEKVGIITKKHQVAIAKTTGEYLGAVPDDLGHLLITLTSGGNQYEAFVVTTATNRLQILIKETCRSAKFFNQPSFVASGQKTYLNIVQTESTVEEKIISDDGETEEVVTNLTETNQSEEEI